MSAKANRAKEKFVLEGLGLSLNRQPSQCEYGLKTDGRLQAQLLAQLELVDRLSHKTVRQALKKRG